MSGQSTEIDVLAELAEAVANAIVDRPQRCGHSSDPMCCPYENFPTLAAVLAPVETLLAPDDFDPWGGRLDHVTDQHGTGSDQHEGNEQPADTVRQEPPVPGVRAEVSDELRREPGDSVEGLPLVRLGEHHGDDRLHEGLAAPLVLHREWGTAEDVREDGFVNPSSVHYAPSEASAFKKAAIRGETPVGRLAGEWRPIAADCDPTCSPHLHQHCSLECEQGCAACASRVNRERAIDTLAEQELVLTLRRGRRLKRVEQRIGRTVATEIVDLIFPPEQGGA